MRQFKCSDLGYECSWSHAALEDLLLEAVALHLRDVHDLTALSQEQIGTIKNLFSSKESAREVSPDEPVFKEYACNLGPDCTWRYIAMTEELIADGAAIHARAVHGIREFSPELIARVKRSIRPWREQGRKTA